MAKHHSLSWIIQMIIFLSDSLKIFLSIKSFVPAKTDYLITILIIAQKDKLIC
jgi:hypothetical protein